MRRQTSFWVLVVLAIVAGIFFFRVVQPFLLPLLLAAVFAMLVRPAYEWTAERLGGWRGLTAALFTVLVLLLVLLPIAAALYLAGRELMHFKTSIAEQDWDQNPLVLRVRGLLSRYLSEEDWGEVKKSGVTSLQGIMGGVYARTQSLISNLFELVVGLAIMCLALFYFLYEGEKFLASLRSLSPLENADEQLLLNELTRVCRGVVLATIVCAFFQALAAGVGYAIAGIERVWLLMVLTMFTSMIPFVGAAAVWLVASGALMWQGSWGAGIFLLIYGATVVSSLDNLLRAYVIGDTAHLHPLVAIISVMGALQYVGLWGVFIGPIVASILYAILKILRDRDWNSESPPSPPASQPVC